MKFKIALLFNSNMGDFELKILGISLWGNWPYEGFNTGLNYPGK